MSAPKRTSTIRWEARGSRRPSDPPNSRYGRGRLTGLAYCVTRTEDPEAGPMVEARVAKTPDDPAGPGLGWPVGRATTWAAARRMAEAEEARARPAAELRIRQRLDAWTPDRRGEPAGPDARPTPALKRRTA